MIFQGKKIVAMIFFCLFGAGVCVAASVDPRVAFLVMNQEQSCVKKFILLEKYLLETSVVLRDDRDFEDKAKKSRVENLYNPADAKIYELWIGSEEDLDLLRTCYGPISFDVLYVLSRGKIEQTFSKEHTENILRNYALKE